MGRSHPVWAQLARFQHDIKALILGRSPYGRHVVDPFDRVTDMRLDLDRGAKTSFLTSTRIVSAGPVGTPASSMTASTVTRPMISSTRCSAADGVVGQTDRAAITIPADYEDTLWECSPRFDPLSGSVAICMKRAKRCLGS